MTQKQAILDLFKKGKTLNLMIAFKETGTFKLSARVSEFKKIGYIFKTERKKFKTKYGTKGCYSNYTLDFKKTPKKLLRSKK